MDISELPRRLYTLGEEPEPHNSISYHTDNTKLHTALREALTDAEFEELKESRLGVFIKFKEQGFGWASRLVHYLLGLKLDIKKKYEMWCLVGPEPARFSLLEFENITGLNCEYIEDLETPECEVTPEMVSFWGMMGVHLEAGPTTDQIIAALKRCGDWSREDRKRLAYLSIFTGFIEGRKFSSATRAVLARLVMDLERFENYPWGRVAFKVLMDSLWNKDITGCYTVDGFIQVLQVWAYTAIPGLGASIGLPRANSPSPPILAYEDSRGRRFMKAAILSQVPFHLHLIPKAWLEDVHIDAWMNVLRQRYKENPQCFRSERMCFLDHNFTQSWREQYLFFKASSSDHNGLGRMLPSGAASLYDGSMPSFCQSNKKWGEDIDDIYAPLNLDNKHWVAIWISIPKRHIVVWDSIPSTTIPERWDEIMEPFLKMVPYLIVECGDQMHGLERYTYERLLKDVPTANNGDCGVYAAKYIECHALGVPFSPKDFARSNAKTMRDNMAVVIWTELVDQHLKDNEDGGMFVGMYD
ncbi:uncharacterized protein LOC130494881 [Raphanus sativus]|uniref:Uncharacterized protein LOC130494881 n=1 Tax=Raphanus sativus TaxID=3726 RepID=A0A9W3BR83_RAPSA|nr:uncharacterized protein LOC130494881 [Raphanus sativus]